MAKIVDNKQNRGFGAWVQADSITPTYIKVVMDGDAAVEIVTSETNGPGAGETSIVEEVIRSTTSMSVPPGAYYINAHVTRNPDESKVTVVTAP